ncbi:hypothetical protein F2Q68_00030258 [Brassica cretica]|uniref:Tryptophan synthase n=1 Tax=Brassica cretica TaxID=69181 RepID=A0A8S9G3N9_BRACR|nr:hypothetical protein F2Q68_00030258 [Brassica cretica]
MSYLLQDDDGQITEPRSISAGLDYPGVGPEHGFLKDVGRADVQEIVSTGGYNPSTGDIICMGPSRDLCPTLPDGTRVVLNFSGRGDKDVQTSIKYLEV